MTVTLTRKEWALYTHEKLVTKTITLDLTPDEFIVLRRRYIQLGWETFDHEPFKQLEREDTGDAKWRTTKPASIPPWADDGAGFSRTS